MSRFHSMDQFRGLTILLMFAVHYSWGIDLSAILRHNHYYLSVGDLVFPWFQLAAGFALRLSLLRRLQTHGPWSAYGRMLRRCLLLILLGDVPPMLGGLHLSHWGPEQGTDLLARVATYVKFDGWTILAIIGVTSMWVLPVIGRSARIRLGFLLGGLALHAFATQVFYLDFMNGYANSVDALLGTVSVRGREGGPLGFLVWAMPQIVGSLVYDLVAQKAPRRASGRLVKAGLCLVAVGYGFSCLSTFYPVARGPQPVAFTYPETEQRTQSPVVPWLAELPTGSWRPSLVDPPFVPPPAERIRVWNYWTMSRRLTTPTFMLTATGFALVVYSGFILLADVGSVRLGVLRTFGQNPLIAYLLDGWVGGLLSGLRHDASGWPWALAESGCRFALTYVPVRLLEWRRIYLRL